MLTFSLQSGSSGNATYVEAGDTRLLFDAGISGRQAELRMARHGRSLRDCQALIISHNHGDHIRCAGTYHRRFGMPVYISENVWNASRRRIGQIHGLRFYEPGDTLQFGDVVVHTLRTPHDGIDTACFVVEHNRRRLGILTDLGRPFAGLRDLIASVDAAYLESNYDPEMLEVGPYPEQLKQRIRGDGGHISNQEAVDLVRRDAASRLQWIATAHLSGENNRPDLAADAYRRDVGTMLHVHHAPRDDVSDVFDV